MTELRAGSATDVGLVRANNQDRFLVASPLFAVADGMGGHAAGEVAASVAVHALRDALGEEDPPTAEGLRSAAQAANRAVWEQAQTDPDLRGMGTTLVAAALLPADGPEGQEALAIVNVGDSRLYRIRDSQIEQLTRDHSLVAELVAGGKLAEEEAEFHPQRNVLTRALGVDPSVPVDLLVVEPKPGDRLVLCSDGLYREVSEGHIAALLRRLADPTEAANELVNEAKLRGGSDNITVVVVDLVPDGAAAGTGGADNGDDPDTTVAPSVLATAGAPPRSDDTQVLQRVEATPEPVAASPADATPPAPRETRAKLITVRVVAFFLAFLLILGIAFGALAWYARDSYFVGLQRDQLTIFQGRPGGVLWFMPTVAAHTTVTTSDVPIQSLDQLKSGQEETSVSAARQYIARLQAQYRQQQQANTPPPTSSTTSPTTIGVTTTVPGTPQTPTATAPALSPATSAP